MFQMFFPFNWFYRYQLFRYLSQRPRIRAQLGLEVDRPFGSAHGIWLYYDYWPARWKNKLTDFFIAYIKEESIPLANALPIADRSLMRYSSQIAYRDTDLAQNTYLAQVAHTLYLDFFRKLPWRLEDWSDHELSYLLSSKVCFRAERLGPDREVYYTVHMSSRSDETENILHDPRIAYCFLNEDPEQGEQLIGATPSETCQRITGWFHDYLWHNPEQLDRFDFYYNHPTLETRIQRHDIEPYGDVYITPSGCGSASSLFADLARSVNIPVRKVTNILLKTSGQEGYHGGLVFDWQGGSGHGRYLMHTDDIYWSTYFKDPAPSPKDTPQGKALWEEVWLKPSRFGQTFSYADEENVFGRATWEQMVKYKEMGDWLVCSANRLQTARSLGNREAVIESLMTQRGFSRTEAEACWEALEATVLSYGDGDMELGYQRLLDGPDSRHQQWCTRTGKC